MPLESENRVPSPSRKAGWKLLVILLFVLGLVLVLAMRGHNRNAPAAARTPTATSPVRASAGAAKASTPGTDGGGLGGKPAPAAAQAAPRKLPKLLDLGAGKCMACKMMEPVLEELRKHCRGKLEVQFIDVWKNPRAGQKFGIRMIPTQIFFAPDGKELWRHVGFISEDDILAKWKALGVDL